MDGGMLWVEVYNPIKSLTFDPSCTKNTKLQIPC